MKQGIRPSLVFIICMENTAIRHATKYNLVYFKNASFAYNASIMREKELLELSQILDYGLARSKWNQYAKMRKDPLLKGMLVPTERYTARRLRRGLKRFSSVFLKPEVGGQGRGIIKIDRLSSGFLIRTGINRILPRTVGKSLKL